MLDEREHTIDLGRPVAMTIGGFDPSAGAGIIADCKTFEQCEVYGLAVCTAITFQNDREFSGLKWISFDQISAQLESLVKRFKITFVKVGIIESLQILESVIDLLSSHGTTPGIIWDPILSASAGFVFHRSWDPSRIKAVLKRCTLITPNLLEISALAPHSDPHQGAAELSLHAAVLLKGGHSHGEVVIDTLYRNGAQLEYRAERLTTCSGSSGKHGSGCALSSAITAALSRGESLEAACSFGHRYVQRLLISNQHRLGFHTPAPAMMDLITD